MICAKAGQSGVILGAVNPEIDADLAKVAERSGQTGCLRGGRFFPSWRRNEKSSDWFFRVRPCVGKAVSSGGCCDPRMRQSSEKMSGTKSFVL